MKKSLIALFLIGAFITPAIAEKPEWTGKGKPTEEQKSAYKTAVETKGDLHRRDDENRKEDKSTPQRGLEKQTSMKSEQVQKELDKGSEKGKSARESNSKKWWKFWDE